MTDDAFAHLVTNYFSAIRYHLIETLQLTFLVIIETLSIVGYQIKSNFGLNNLKKSQMSFMKSQISKNWRFQISEPQRATRSEAKTEEETEGRRSRIGKFFLHSFYLFLDFSFHFKLSFSENSITLD
jgi:hypothetical protein